MVSLAGVHLRMACQAVKPGRPCAGPLRTFCLVVWPAVISEGDLNGPFVGAADDGELDGAARRGLECVEQVVGGAYRLTRGHQRSGRPGRVLRGRRAVLNHVADEQAVSVGQAHGTAEPPGHVVRRDGDAEPG